MPTRTVASPAFLDALFEGVSDGLCLVAPDGTVLRVNQAWLRSTGFYATQVVGADILDLFPESRELARAVHARARAGERVRVPAHRQALLGRETWWDGSVAPVPMAGGVGLLITAREIGHLQQQALLDALHEEQGLLRLALEGSPTPMAVLDRELRYLAVSPSWLRATGLAASPIGRTVDEVFPGQPDRRRAVYERALAGEVVACAEDTYVRPDGGVIHFTWSCRPWLSGAGGVGGVFTHAELLGPRRELEAALAASEARHRAFFEHLAEEVSIYEVERDDGGRVVDWIFRAANAQARRQIGEEASRALRGRRLTELYPDAQVRASVAATEEILAGKVRIEPYRFEPLGTDYLSAAFAVDARTVATASINLTALAAAGAAAPTLADLGRTVARLQASLDPARALQGLLRICMHCHRLRTDDGAWETVEAYLRHRSATLLSHGICPACLEAHYPDGQ